MVYAGVMYGPLRMLLLLSALLMQSWGSAHTAQQLTLAMQEQGQEMPCHGQQAGSKEQTAMPCCGADDLCTCTVGCFANGGAVAPQPAASDDYMASHFSVTTSPGDLLPAHPLGLLRPPTRQES